MADAVRGELFVSEASEQKWKQFAEGNPPERLTTPLTIEPQDSKAGMLGFWLSDAFASVFGPHLKAAGVARINPRLEIHDYVSDSSVTVPVPGSHP